MKKIISILLILIILFSSVSVYASGDSYNYVDYDKSTGEVVKKQSPKNVIDFNNMRRTDLVELQTGWYIIKNSCTIGQPPRPPFYPGGMGIIGDVHIIVCDGVTLTVEGGFGINSDSGKEGRLYIHGQGRGNANLVIKGMVTKEKILSGRYNYANGQGVELTEFSVYGCNVTITAADGLRGEAPFDGCGKNGYAGMQNTNAHFYNSSIKIYGGNGGDSGAKKALYGKKNNGGDAANAIFRSSIELMGSTLELYGGNGGKHLAGIGTDGRSADAVYSSSIHTDDAAISDGQTGELIKNKDFSKHHSVIITSDNFTVSVGSIISNGSLIIIATVVAAVSATIIILIKRKKKEHASVV